MRLEVDHQVGDLHVLTELAGYFLEYLLSEVAHLHTVRELYELYDVALGTTILRWVQSLAITVELVHWREVCLANTHDNDRAGQPCQLDDQVDCLLHVNYLAVCQNKEYLVNGLSLSLVLRAELLELFKQRSKQCWAIQSDLIYCCFVSRHNSCYACNVCTLWVAIHWEAMTHLLNTHVSGDPPEAIHREHLVVVIVLHYRTYLQQGLFVLVTWAHVVQTRRWSWVAVASCVVYSDGKRQLPSCPKVISEAWHGHWFVAQENKLTAFFTLKHQSFLSQVLDSEGSEIPFNLVCHDWNLKQQFRVWGAKGSVVYHNKLTLGAFSASN